MSRDLRRSVRSIEKQVEDSSDPKLTDGDVETIREGLAADESRTRRRTVSAVSTIGDAGVDVGRFDDGLVAAIETGIDGDDDARRCAERAARALVGDARDDPGRVDGFDSLAARLLETDSARLRTGGAVLLGPALLDDEYDPPDGVALDLATHAILVEALVDDPAQRVDDLGPTLFALARVAQLDPPSLTEESPSDSSSVLLAAAASGTGVENVGIDADDLLEQVIGGVAFDRYLTGLHDGIAGPAATFLAAAAEHRPEAVERYLLDLTGRLRDPEPQIVLKAGDALASVAAESDAGVDALRPTVHLGAALLDHDDPAALGGVLTALSPVAEAAPDWAAALPIESIADLPERDAVADDPRIGAEAVAVVGGLATVAPELADASLAEFALEGVLGAAPPAETVSRTATVRQGLADAARAAPDAVLPALFRAGADAPVADLDHGALAEALMDTYQNALGGEDGRPVEGCLAVSTASGAIADAIDAGPPGTGDPAPFEWVSAAGEGPFERVLAAAGDEERPTWERRIAAHGLVRADADALGADRRRAVAALADDLSDAADGSLVALGDELAAAVGSDDGDDA